MVSPRKSNSSINLAGEEYGSNGAVNKLAPSNRKSSESLYSAISSHASASLVYRRKMPTHFVTRPPALIPATTEVQQRVISARRLRFKNVQNQLGLAQHKITELSNELRVLRTLNKRQNNALEKYESTNAELPRLLHSHAEELRVWQTKYRSLQLSHKEIEQKIKQKESIILTLTDENKYYSQLNKDKNLDDRQRLAEKLQSLELRLTEKENEVKIVERRAHLEIKNLKQQLLSEQKKTKDVLQKLEKARMELSNYQKLDELNISEKMACMTTKSACSKLDTSKSSRKVAKGEKSLGSANMNSSKTPSPSLDVAGVGGNGADEEDSDFLTSHRSQKSTNSSTNIDFSTRETVRKVTPSNSNKKHRKDNNLNSPSNVIEMIGDGPVQRKKLEKTELKRKSTKMMVNMPNYDGGDSNGNATLAGDDDDGNATLAGDDDDEDTVLGGDSLDSMLDGDLDYNYTDDFDDNGDEDVNEAMKQFEEDERLTSREMFSDNGEDESPGRINESSIMKIRNKINSDYKDREAFLDTFCRQASCTTITTRNVDNAGDLSPSNSSGTNANGNRKHKLLAALKAIDDDQCSGQD